jgi:IS5 family transposase
MCLDETILNFRHLLERHELTKAIFAAVSEHLAAKGELLRGGTIVDATLIAASPSTKNKEGRRDPEMSQSKKGNQWYFGMEAHVGVDAESGRHARGAPENRTVIRRTPIATPPKQRRAT